MHPWSKAKTWIAKEWILSSGLAGGIGNNSLISVGRACQFYAGHKGAKKDFRDVKLPII